MPRSSSAAVRAAARTSGAAIPLYESAGGSAANGTGSSASRASPDSTRTVRLGSPAPGKTRTQTSPSVRRVERACSTGSAAQGATARTQGSSVIRAWCFGVHQSGYRRSRPAR
ncbi:hypothetical protein [Streptomyces virginiae]|uniref:hypothetical protein n=1 Tax=Streptomyces virginiae TaxID=1961 RepID=UPI0022530E53|nr:hypothetical protein [Streptomyces virginiae]MCX5275131.1 hypothetical protein [Streptomyces virginiae]